jgi:hypothetical protein
MEKKPPAGPEASLSLSTESARAQRLWSETELRVISPASLPLTEIRAFVITMKAQRVPDLDVLHGYS